MKPFDIEEALLGEPIDIRFPDSSNIRRKAYLHQSHITKDGNRFILEFDNLSSLMVVSSEELHRFVSGMWEEEYLFKYWHLLHPNADLIHKLEHYWQIPVKREGVFLIPINSVSADFFPDCPVGTVIKKPESWQSPDDDIPF